MLSITDPKLKRANRLIQGIEHEENRQTNIECNAVKFNSLRLRPKDNQELVKNKLNKNEKFKQKPDTEEKMKAMWKGNMVKIYVHNVRRQSCRSLWTLHG